jgi:hypothetical protein
MKLHRILALAALVFSLAAQGAAGDYVDRSGTITTGGTSQELVAANPGRGNITIYNLSTETEVLCVNVTSAASCTAAGSWHITPGGSITLTTKEVINVVAATTGHKFTAKENLTDGFALSNTGTASISGGAGDASAANQVTGNASLASIDGKTPALVSGRQPVDGSGVTQPVSAASLPLPTGAATAAKQPALGTAGVSSTDVISVQGIASGTALPVSGTVAATQSGNWTARLADGAGNNLTSAARGSERAISVQIVDGSGAQVTTFGGSGGTASTVGSATPSTATAIGGNDGTNMQVPRVADIDTGAGTQYALVTSPRIGASGGGVELTGGAGAVAAGTLRTTQASDSPLVATLGATGDAAATQGSTGTVSAKLREMSSSLGTINTSLGTINTSINASNPQLPAALGQTTMANSLPVTLASNQSNVPANIAQINGVTPLMGAGNGGTGSQRVNIATDQAAIATHGHGATGAAVPANAQLAGGRSGANMVSFPVSDTTAPISMSTATTTQMIALSGSTKTYIDNLSIMAGGAANVTLVYGTGANCGTGQANLTGAYPLAANGGLVLQRVVVPAGQALCVTSSAAVSVVGHVTYTQF